MATKAKSDPIDISTSPAISRTANPTEAIKITTMAGCSAVK